MAKHQSSPSASSPERKSPQPRPAGDAIDLSAAATAASGPNASSSSSPPAGFIFMCSGATKPECFRYRVLGLPRGRLDDVSRIRRGAGLFLYDFDSKYLYGPYRADSDGGLALEPAAFKGRYPAQVKFTIDGDFMPIPESSVRSAIKENYSRGKFWPELTFMQVEKLRALFRPITVLPESASSADDRHYVDSRHPAPSAASGSHPTYPAINRHPDPSTAYLPPSASHPTQPAINRHPDPSTAYLSPSAYHPTQPAAYVHYPSAYVPAQAAHLVPQEPYAHPYSHLPPPTAQLTAPAYYATPAGHTYQPGYESYDPLPAAYHYTQAPPSCYSYVQTQHLVPQHVPHPVYSTDPYFAANRDDPYRFDALKSHYQETTSERTSYGAAHENLQLVRHYGHTPSSETAAPEAATTNLGLVRSYGSVSGRATEGTTQTNADGAAYHIQEEALRQSGADDAMVMKAEMARYANDKRVTQPFRRHHWWEAVRNEAKWKGQHGPGSGSDFTAKRSRLGVSGEYSSSEATTEEERPTGRDRAKAAARKDRRKGKESSSSSEVTSKSFAMKNMWNGLVKAKLLKQWNKMKDRSTADMNEAEKRKHAKAIQMVEKELGLEDDDEEEEEE